jgi:succinate dehydrogenase / fumarate reductase membrane anchor subunit
MVKYAKRGRHGHWHWLMQHFSARVMAIYSVLLIAVLLIQQPAEYAGWKDLFSQVWMRLATLLFLLSLLLHAWIGVSNVLNDYVKPLWLRYVLQKLVEVVLFVYTLWSIQILWSI